MLEARNFFHSINVKRKNHFNPLLEKYDLTFLELEILAFLRKAPDSNTFTQIMKSKDYAKSHVSTAINHLVACGYLSKTGATSNKKVYHLHLLEKSNQVIQDYYHYDQAFQARGLSQISPAELAVFNKVIEKINQNLQSE